MTARSKVLITGAAGRIGSFLTQYLADRYDFVQFEDFGESLQRGGDEAQDQFIFAGSLFEASGVFYAMYN